MEEEDSRFIWSSVAALMYGGLATWFTSVTGYLHGPPGGGGRPLSIAAIFSAVGIGYWTWNRWVEGRESPSVLLAGVSGLVTGTLSHVTMWFMWGLWNVIEAPALLSGWVLPAIFSLLFFGWATAAIGTFGGVLLGAIRVIFAKYW